MSCWFAARDLHAMIIQAQAVPNPSLPSQSSHIFKFTELSGPLSNYSSVSFESRSKKRKFSESQSNEVECSTLPAISTSETTHTQVHKIIKKECEELVELIVHLSIFILFFHLLIPIQYRIKLNCGSPFHYQSK